MAHIDASPTAKMPSSAGAQRMRLFRLRKRCGLRCFTLELSQRHIDALVRHGLLKKQASHNSEAVLQALYIHLARAFGA
jgi:hypothetical protein